MTIKKCDRCGAIYEFSKGDKKREEYFVRRKVLEGLSNERIVDLCPACKEELKQWMEGESLCQKKK